MNAPTLGRFVTVVSRGHDPFPTPKGARRVNHASYGNYQDPAQDLSWTSFRFLYEEAATRFCRDHPELSIHRDFSQKEAIATSNDNSTLRLTGMTPTLLPRQRGSAYATAILESVPGCRIEDTYQVEEVMRGRFSTLDHLDRDEFRREAVAARFAVQELRRAGTFVTPYYEVTSCAK